MRQAERTISVRVHGPAILKAAWNWSIILHESPLECSVWYRSIPEIAIESNLCRHGEEFNSDGANVHFFVFKYGLVHCFFTRDESCLNLVNGPIMQCFPAMNQIYII